jgi:DNA-binding CsgD family transcriptional regulator
VTYGDSLSALGSNVTNVGSPVEAKIAVQWPAVTNTVGEMRLPEQKASPVDRARDALAFAEEAMPPVSPNEEAVIQRCRGIVGEEAVYENSFERALSLHDAELFPFERARTELTFGERLRRNGNRRRARERLHAALRAFDDLGAEAWATRARAEIASTGERLRTTPEARESLTPREMQVALAVARGSSNNEVAAELFLTPKTVEYHLTRVYRKLGLRSRAELVRNFAQSV